MSYPIKKERNKLVVKLKDEKKWSFSEIAKEVGLKSKSTVHFIYYSEKARSSMKNKNKKLSTVTST